MPAAEWSTIFVPTDENGDPMPPESLSLIIALQELRPAHDRFYIRGLDGHERELS
jgi:hypothetical protein